jgi:molybdopterin converting factor subunit 1
MIVRVHLFARARDLAGRDMMEVTLPAQATVADLRHCLGNECSTLRDLLARCAVAVNEEFANDAQQLPAEAEVAILPPVSGGSR